MTATAQNSPVATRLPLFPAAAQVIKPPLKRACGALQNAKTAINQNKLVGVDTTVIRAQVKTLPFRLKIVPDSAALRVATKNALETQIIKNQKPGAQIALTTLKLDNQFAQPGNPLANRRYSEYAVPNPETGGQCRGARQRQKANLYRPLRTYKNLDIRLCSSLGFKLS